MYICIDQKTGKRTVGFNTLDEAQQRLLLLQTVARKANKICYYTIIEVDDVDALEDDEFVVY